MTDHLTQKDRRALGLPRDDVPQWVVLVIGLIRAATQ